MIRTAATALALLAAPVAAETLEFDADGGVAFIRCAPFWAEESVAACEAIFPQGTEVMGYECVAFGSNGRPLAVSYGPEVIDGVVGFSSLDHTLVADMKCRKRE